MRTTLAFAFASLAAIGCNTTTEGANGNIAFTPDNCSTQDLRGCDFADSLGVGGKSFVQIEGVDGFSTAGVDLDTDDPDVLVVAPVADWGGRPTWEVTGTGPGVGRIVAYDPDQVQVDFVEVGVQLLSGLTTENFIGDAVGPDADPSYDEVWTINAGEQVSFYVTPLIGDGVPTMGRYQYDAVVDEVLFANQTTQSDPAGGYLDFTVPAGEYPVTFENLFQQGLTLDVLFVAQ
ncbi:MAG TPA: hypothetical protein VL172_21935 [Kofleriaceae bacterium]|jgi:hypothetical protein|nr:hypothetical protein [Kofleriaceae bacterium]